MEHNEEFQVGYLSKFLFGLSLWLNAHQETEMRWLLSLGTCSSVLGCVAIETSGSIGQWCEVSVYVHLQDNIGNYLPLTIIYHKHMFLKTIPIPRVLRIRAFKNWGEDPK